MTGPVILALVAFVALILALLLVLRGMGQVIASTRADEAFRRNMADVVGRASNVLRGVVEQADGARYRGGTHPDLERSVTLTTSQLAELKSELNSIQVPVDRHPDRDAVARDLGTLSDALEVLEHGSGDGTADPTDRRIALKRGYLALAHAERSLTEHADALSRDRPRPDRRLFRR